MEKPESLEAVGAPRWMWFIPVAGILSIGIAAFVLTRKPSEPDRYPIVTTRPIAVDTVVAKAPPATIAIAPVVTSPQPTNAELESLRAENERLKNAIAIKNAPAPRPASLKITGTAWLSRNNGASDLLRGLHVQLIDRKLPGSLIAAGLHASGDSHKRMRDFDQKQVEYWDVAIKRGSDYEFSKKTHDEYQSKVDDSDKRIAEIKSTIGALPSSGLDALIAYRLMESHDISGIAHFGEAESFIDVVTDADGKYSLKFSPGSYYLHARLSTGLILVEWLIPIESSDSDSKIDLFNDNAIAIHNLK